MHPMSIKQREKHSPQQIHMPLMSQRILLAFSRLVNQFCANFWLVAGQYVFGISDGGSRAEKQ
jgi:hypothetical protein